MVNLALLTFKEEVKAMKKIASFIIFTIILVLLTWGPFLSADMAGNESCNAFTSGCDTGNGNGAVRTVASRREFGGKYAAVVSEGRLSDHEAARARREHNRDTGHDIVIVVANQGGDRGVGPAVRRNRPPFR